MGGEEPPSSPDVVQIQLRLPSGSRLMRRFPRSATLQAVLDWIESEPTAYAQPNAFRVVQKWPGHCRELGPADAQQTLGDLGFTRQEALFFQPVDGEALQIETEANPLDTE